MKNINQFLPFGKVWAAVPPRRDCPGLAVYLYSFALDASNLQPPKLFQHRGAVVPEDPASGSGQRPREVGQSPLEAVIQDGGIGRLNFSFVLQYPQIKIPPQAEPRQIP